jgi:hypothetical protein
MQYVSVSTIAPADHASLHDLRNYGIMVTVHLIIHRRRRHRACRAGPAAI